MSEIDRENGRNSEWVGKAYHFLQTLLKNFILVTFQIKFQTRSHFYLVTYLPNNDFWIWNFGCYWHCTIIAFRINPIIASKTTNYLTAIDKENILLALEAVPMEMEKMISIQAMKPTERKLTLKR